MIHQTTPEKNRGTRKEKNAISLTLKYNKTNQQTITNFALTMKRKGKKKIHQKMKLSKPHATKMIEI